MSVEIYCGRNVWVRYRQITFNLNVKKYVLNRQRVCVCHRSSFHEFKARKVLFWEECLESTCRICLTHLVVLRLFWHFAWIFTKYKGWAKDATGTSCLHTWSMITPHLSPSLYWAISWVVIVQIYLGVQIIKDNINCNTSIQSVWTFCIYFIVKDSLRQWTKMTNPVSQQNV